MRKRTGLWGALGGLGLLLGLLVGCGQMAASTVGDQAAGGAAPTSAPAHLTLDVPDVWGGEVRCDATGCRLALVEHERGQLVLFGFSDRSAHELARHPLAYHPDSAIWLDDEWVVAAVEKSNALESFRVVGERLEPGPIMNVGFSPRDVIMLTQSEGHYTLLATPFGGDEVSVVEWRTGAAESTLHSARWCKTPWHPARVVRAPDAPSGGVVVACLDDRQVVFVSASDWLAPPRVLARFDAVARHARPSPSGRWLYVALETGGRNARIDMDSGELQYLSAPLTGAVAAAPLADDEVVWGDANDLFLQRYDAQGTVLQTRWLKPSGFPTGLQLIDVDGDGERDLVVLNSAGKRSDVFFGPLWPQARDVR